MKRAILGLFAAAVIIFFLLQFWRPDWETRPVDPAQTIEAEFQLPADVKVILERSCTDCHSNVTKFPWYSHIAPVSWFLADHIRHARHELNLSEWKTYAQEKQQRKLEEICDVVRSREMPLPSYLWMHRDAALSPSDIEVLCSWTSSLKVD